MHCALFDLDFKPSQHVRGFEVYEALKCIVAPHAATIQPERLGSRLYLVNNLAWL
jgi:hypothetical protein